MQPGTQQVMMKGRIAYLEMFTPNAEGEVKITFGQGLEAVVTLLLDVRDLLLSVNSNGQIGNQLIKQMVDHQATQGIDLTKLRG